MRGKFMEYRCNLYLRSTTFILYFEVKDGDEKFIVKQILIYKYLEMLPL